MRYERMLLAAIASIVFVFLGANFAMMAMRVAAESAIFATFGFDVPSLRFVMFAAAGGGLLSLGLAFLLFAVIKVDTRNVSKYGPLLVKLRNAGIRLVWVAVAFACLWFAANVALEIGL